MSAYLDTRVSLYASQLWRNEELDKLVDAPDDALPDVLSRRGLPHLAADLPGKDSRSLEQHIIAQILDETRVLIRPLSGDARNFLIFWTARFEISNVKTLLRSKMTGERPAAVLARLTPMTSFGSLDYPALAHAEDVSELFRRLETGPYAGIVRQARRAFEQSHDPFSLDAALDRAYYESLVQHAQPLEAALGVSFHSLMAHLVDAINLIWLLRYRFNYKLPPAQVYYLLVGSHYGLPGSRLRELAALDSLEAVLAALPEAWQKRLSGAVDIPGVFARLDQATTGQAVRVLHSRADGLARAFAYLILREHDLRAIRAVLRGRRLGLAEADIRQAAQGMPSGLT
ncbi:MAG: V-type ATPase subunit [Thiobacillus sp.]